MKLHLNILAAALIGLTSLSAHAALPFCSVSNATWEDIPTSPELTDGYLTVFGWYSGAAAYTFSLQTKIDSETTWRDAGIAQSHEVDGNKQRWGLGRDTLGLTTGTHTVYVRASDSSTGTTRLCGSTTFKVVAPPTGECVAALNSAHITANRAYKLLSYTYAKGSNDALGLTTAVSSLEKVSEGNWRKVASCQ